MKSSQNDGEEQSTQTTASYQNGEAYGHGQSYARQAETFAYPTQIGGALPSYQNENVKSDWSYDQSSGIIKLTNNFVSDLPSNKIHSSSFCCLF